MLLFHRLINSTLNLTLLGIFILQGCGGGGGGSNPPPDPQPPVPPTARIIFVTSDTGSANLSSWADAGGNTGLAAGDAICQAHADAAGLSGTFVAWLSDDTDDAYCRVHGLTGKKSANCGQSTLPMAAGRWLRTDGFPFSDTIDKALAPTNQIFSPLRFDESGTPVPNSHLLTGTMATGIASTNYPYCDNWTNTAAGSVTTGGTELSAGQWTHSGSAGCDNLDTRLICMQIGTGPDLPDFAVSGKQAFVTSTFQSSGNLGGLAGADSICNGLATTASLSGTFKAWLSTSLVDAFERFTTNGPWVRLDGVPIANNMADLIDGSLFTGLDQDEQGNYHPNNGVWTGTTQIGEVQLNHCNDWTDGTNGFNGAYGSTSKAYSAWTQWGDSLACDSTWLRLYCLED